MHAIDLEIKERARRAKAQWTNAEIAERMNLARPEIGANKAQVDRWLDTGVGGVAIPARAVVALAEALETTPAYLLGTQDWDEAAFAEVRERMAAVEQKHAEQARMHRALVAAMEGERLDPADAELLRTTFRTLGSELGLEDAGST
jgi:transcriptional regulator with XRE-family HTH domain